MTTITVFNPVYNAKLSDETMNYTATIAVDGVKAISASNHGQGGDDEYLPLRSRGAKSTEAELQAFKEAMQKLEALAKERPPREAWGRLVPWSVEGIITDAVAEALERKAMKAKMSKSVCIRHEGSNYTLSAKASDYRENEVFRNSLREDLARRYPGHIVLNDLSEDEAFKLWLTEDTSQAPSAPAPQSQGKPARTPAQ